MKKTKTNKKMFTIFSAILGVVFAFITGFTYCLDMPNLDYGSVPNSAAAYLGNQQYHLINDTINSPVLFGEGAHNFEIAIQYSYSYDFDVRLAYSLSWSGGASVDNVILNFANRDNIIYDESYIYLANSVSAGSGKITFITGVEFVDPTSEDYAGKKLTITISEVKIYKAQETYNTDNKLMKVKNNGADVTLNTTAAQAWLQYKKNQTGTADAYVMMYNYRRNYEHGVPYPGLNTAYNKPVAPTNYEYKYKNEQNEDVVESYKSNNVYGAVWTGGNRAYAGTGMYVIAGSDNLELEVQVAGIWRDSSFNEVDNEPGAAIFENNIQYNYSNKWNFKNYNGKLWEVHTLKYYIPARTSCYLEINDSVEVTSAGRTTSIAYDAYRLVTNSIIINPSLGETYQTAFSYTEDLKPEDSVDTCAYIQYSKINNNVDVADTSAYSQEEVSIVNTTTYSNGLYNTLDGDQQSFNANLTAINNTGETKEVKIDLTLYYHLSNGKTSLYDDNGKRAKDLISESQFKNPFNSSTTYSSVNTLYFSYTGESNENLTSAKSFTIKLAPYSSVNLTTSYKVGDGMKTVIKDLFDDPNTANVENTRHRFVEYYDVWTYLVPTVTTGSASTSSLTLETTRSGSSTIVSVKNNTSAKVTGISLNNLAIEALGGVTYNELTGADAPYDWDATYWQYYTKNQDGSYSQVTTKSSYAKNTYYEKSQIYAGITSTKQMLNDFAESGNVISNDEYVLMPGESVDVAQFNTTAQVIVSGTAIALNVSALSDLEIINNGTTNAYIVNYSSSSYYLKIAKTITGSKFAKFDDDATNYYYIGIVRPGQMIHVSLGAEIKDTDITKIVASEVYSEGLLTGWSTKAVAAMTNYFNMNKTQQSS